MSTSALTFLRQPLFAVGSEMACVTPRSALVRYSHSIDRQGAFLPDLPATRERIGYLACTVRIANRFGEQPTARVNAVLKALEE